MAFNSAGTAAAMTHSESTRLGLGRVVEASMGRQSALDMDTRSLADRGARDRSRTGKGDEKERCAVENGQVGRRQGSQALSFPIYR